MIKNTLSSKKTSQVAVFNLKISKDIYLKTEEIYQDILNSKFNRSLLSGNLCIKKFQEFLREDHFFLKSQARILTKAIKKYKESPSFENQEKAKKAKNILNALNDRALELLEIYLTDLITLEQDMIESFFINFDISDSSRSDFEGLLVGKATRNYIGYIQEKAEFFLKNEDSSLLLITILPCLQIFYRLGQSLTQAELEKNPYKAWLQTYRDPNLKQLIIEIIKTLNKQLFSEENQAKAKINSTNQSKINCYQNTYLQVFLLERSFICQKKINLN